MFLVLSNTTLLRQSCRSCRPCYISKIRCNRDLPSCQSCVRRGRPDLCVYEEISQQPLGQLGKWRGLRPNDFSTQHEELFKCETETQQDCSAARQPAIQRTGSEGPDVETTSSTQERAEAKPIPKGCHLESTTHEVDNDYHPSIANAILPDAEWTKPYFEMSLPVKMSGSTTLEALFADDCAD